MNVEFVTLKFYNQKTGSDFIIYHCVFPKIVSCHVSCPTLSFPWCFLFSITGVPYISESSDFTGRLDLFSRWVLLFLGFLEEKSRSQWLHTVFRATGTKVKVTVPVKIREFSSVYLKNFFDTQSSNFTRMIELWLCVILFFGGRSQGQKERSQKL